MMTQSQFSAKQSPIPDKPPSYDMKAFLSGDRSYFLTADTSGITVSYWAKYVQLVLLRHESRNEAK